MKNLLYFLCISAADAFREIYYNSAKARNCDEVKNFLEICEKITKNL